MDDTDINLCQILFRDSRMPIRDLADELGISVQAVHRRIQLLKDIGVLCRFKANVSTVHLHAVPIYLMGLSSAVEYIPVMDALKESEFTNAILVSGGNRFMIYAILRSIDDLEPYLEFVRSAGKMENLMVNIEGSLQLGKKPARVKCKDTFELSDIDYSILYCLRDDSRKGVADIAQELGVSSKTVKRRLDRMIEEQAVELSLDWNPGFAGGALGFILVQVAQDLDKANFKARMIDRFGPRLIFYLSFSNDPTSILFYTWSPTAMDHKSICDVISKESGVSTVASYIIQEQCSVPTWRDRLLEQRAGPDKRAH
jgi:Lrp/AsnC family transcriptional regulator, leucine-responsive regulatory protein